MSEKFTFLILSGPTKEYIDPVRYISNESSGKMGLALASYAVKKGYKVIFISGEVKKYPKKVELIKVTTALDMFKASKFKLQVVDIVIIVAAVADYRPVKLQKHKIKRSGNSILLKFKKNFDIVKYCGKNKSDQVVAGFALETQNLLANAKLKLKNKNLDLIVANGIDSFGCDKTTVHLMRSCSDNVVKIENRNKKFIAGKIIDETVRIFKTIKSFKKNT
ncbi:MAG: phosphopantothenoylcysteine decarboxylase [Endomicrobium sp.]|jgi:phosphopantothenoylcysteine synthetase/decarboxylase|nr:phosphopantothenoylcysteine decarboxylase [Endomicrobium sp.]